MKTPITITLIAGLVAAIAGTADAQSDDACDPVLERFQIGRLLERLKDSDPEMRKAAIFDLQGLRADAKQAIPALLDLLQHDENAGVRLIVLLALFDIDPHHHAVVPTLCQTLEDKADYVRKEAAKVLRKFGPRAKQAVPALIRALKDREVRPWAAGALVAINPDDNVGLSTLIKDLADPRDVAGRREAGRVLGSLGSKAGVAVPALRGALKDADSWVRQFAAKALREIGPEATSAVPALAAALTDPDYMVRFQAAVAIVSLDPNNEAPVPYFIRQLHDKGEMERFAIGLQMGVVIVAPLATGRCDCIQSEFRSRRDELSRLESLIHMQRVSAASFLGRLGPKAARLALPALQEAANDPDQEIREKALKSLEKIQTKLRQEKETKRNSTRSIPARPSCSLVKWAQVRLSGPPLDQKA
jgi:HEAT repeat protein